MNLDARLRAGLAAKAEELAATAPDSAMVRARTFAAPGQPGRQEQRSRGRVANWGIGIGLAAAAALVAVVVLSPPQNSTSTETEVATQPDAPAPTEPAEGAESDRATAEPTAEPTPEATAPDDPDISFPPRPSTIPPGNRTCRARQFVVPIAHAAPVSDDCSTIGAVGSELPVDCRPSVCRAPIHIRIEPRPISVVLNELVDDESSSRRSTSEEWLVDGRQHRLIEVLFDDPLVGPTTRRTFLLETGQSTLVIEATEKTTMPSDWNETQFVLWIAVTSRRIDAIDTSAFRDGDAALCPSFGGGQVIADGPAAGGVMIEPLSSTGTGRGHLAGVYFDQGDCEWNRVLELSYGQVPGDGYGCRVAGDALVFLEWETVRVTADLDGKRLATDTLTLARAEVHTPGLPTPFGSSPTFERIGAMPNGVSSCVNPQPHQGWSPSLPGSVDSETGRCRVDPEVGLAPAQYLDLDGDGIDEALLPRAGNETRAGTAIVHAFYAPEENCEWRQLATQTQLSSGYQRWGCHAGTARTLLVNVATDNVDPAEAEYGLVTVTEAGTAIGNGQVVAEFAYDHEAMQGVGTTPCAEAASAPPDPGALQRAFAAVEGSRTGITEGEHHCVTGIDDGDSLNVRSGPGTGFTVVAELLPGACFARVHGQASQDGWLPVGVVLSAPGGFIDIEGWAFGDYLTPARALDTFEASAVRNPDEMLVAVEAFDPFAIGPACEVQPDGATATCMVAKWRWTPPGSPCGTQPGPHWTHDAAGSITVTRTETGELELDVLALAFGC